MFMPLWFNLRLSLAVLVALLLMLASIAIVRADSPGDLDLSFNSTGIVTTPVIGPWLKLYSAAIQPDGKILVAGLTTSTLEPKK